MVSAATIDNPAALAERYLLGAVLHLRGAEARTAVARVRVDDLADAQLRTILEAAQSLAADGLDPDPARITPRMLELGLCPRDRAGLANVALVELLTSVPAPECWSAYAAEVLRESARRTIREAATRALQAADGPNLSTAVAVLSAGLEAVCEAVSRAIEAAS